MIAIKVNKYKTNSSTKWIESWSRRFGLYIYFIAIVDSKQKQEQSQNTFQLESLWRNVEIKSMLPSNHHFFDLVPIEGLVILDFMSQEYRIMQFQCSNGLLKELSLNMTAHTKQI